MTSRKKSALIAELVRNNRYADNSAVVQAAKRGLEKMNHTELTCWKLIVEAKSGSGKN